MDLILIVLILLIPMIAQVKVSTTYKKYQKEKNNKGLCGQEVARKILEANNLTDIYVVETRGELTDHYDPNRKVIRLSNNIFHNDSIASLSVAAHECGHAIQDKEGYFFLKLRSFIYPIVNVATSMSYFIIFIGILLKMLDMVYLGIIFTAFGLLFQIITLPVEFNASKRALKEIEKLNIVNESEKKETKKMLTAAALTYVAGVLASLLQIIRLLLMFRNDRR